MKEDGRRPRVAWSRSSVLLAIAFLAGCSPQAGSVSDKATPAPATATTAPLLSSPTVAPPTAPTGEPVATGANPTERPTAVETNFPRADAPGPSVIPNSTTAVVSSYRIEIPRLGINLPVAEGDVPRDVEREQTPENYALHLPGTSLFGGGNTYIYAHARVGMFLSLWNARVGDLVIVRTPLGPREYVVAEVHPRVPPTETSWAGPTSDTRLTLQTSTGPNSDDPRFVVIARPQ